jgi:hypothetical protein
MPSRERRRLKAHPAGQLLPPECTEECLKAYYRAMSSINLLLTCISTVRHR